MTTLIIKGDSEVINQILDLIKEVKDKVTLSKTSDPIKESILKDIEAYRNGELDTITLQELEKRALLW
ncbi:hypothetical protein [Campylobacter corcagiensis]|uniref:Uncharacterized protein n=1 Tax=Campylobacter corcagiensis TaxID=1448857 RepID=A0A7M1LIH0_9BACT|nr:hypothetical protein [Campylobacter corcagiensis]QKF64044.1 hypothetical protein CCORG_0155 [Campylobacter corcagiensis]QOQ87754.1 hypothetical protein IMC76_02795 [Campylobacter corcagiensis]